MYIFTVESRSSVAAVIYIHIDIYRYMYRYMFVCVCIHTHIYISAARPWTAMMTRVATVVAERRCAAETRKLGVEE